MLRDGLEHSRRRLLVAHEEVVGVGVRLAPIIGVEACVLALGDIENDLDVLALGVVGCVGDAGNIRTSGQRLESALAG